MLDVGVGLGAVVVQNVYVAPPLISMGQQIVLRSPVLLHLGAVGEAVEAIDDGQSVNE